MTTSSRQNLLRTEGRAADRDSKTVIIHKFDVPPGVEGLALRFDYGPRFTTNVERNTRLVEAALEKADRRREALRPGLLEEHRRELGGMYKSINNLMNVVLIDPAGRWRGRWDRNPSAEAGDLYLGREKSSKGFLPGDLTAGKWSVAVECHGVFGDPVSYQLEVDGLASPPEIDDSAPPPRKAAAFPRRSGPGWYFGEMHSHTVHSDGKHELAELTSRAAALGIDFLSLTDHNTTSGLLEQEDFPLTVVPGCELTTFHGHHPIYGIDDIVPWHVEGRVLGLPELAPKIRAMGGVVSVAHPFKMGDPICTGCRMPDELDPKSFDLFEVWYRRWDATETDNEAAYALWNDYWKKGLRVTAVAARDWHGPSQEGPFPGPMAFTGVWAEDNTPKAIVDGMRRGRVIMSGGPIMDLFLQAADGSRAGIGESLFVNAATAHVKIDRLEGPAELRLFQNGEQVKSMPVSGNGSHVIEGVANRPGYYRAELWHQELPRCLTNHVVLEGPRQ